MGVEVVCAAETCDCDTGWLRMVEEVAVECECGGTVVAGGAQSKPTLWMPTWQLEFLPPLGTWNVTDVAPPH